ncbi:hypothetical protein, partial [Streptomyces sp. P17]|uniref:hypothetical protein n=1 Tax=Streptomyces sp. P17 TaxID=3074716 RepID=UPI0028F3E890
VVTNMPITTSESTGARPATTITATLPEKPGTNTETIKEGPYGGYKFEVYRMVIKAKIKDDYSYEKNPTEYLKILQLNDGLGLANQASIMWNGETNS